MSFSFGFYNALNHDRLYDAIQVSEIFDGLIRDGIYSTIGDHYVVKASENENEVIVGSGRAWFDHTWNKNDADLPITAPLPDLLMKRYDALVIDINANVSSRTNAIIWVEGTPSLNTPVKPTLTNTTDHHQYPLCYILRTANNNTIIQDDIENTIGTDECPFVTGILQQVSISDLLLQWTSQFATFMNNNEQTASAWEAEWEASMNQWTVEQKNEFATWMAGEKTEFDDWFANLHYILDGDVAGHLQNEIDAIEEGLGGSVFTIHTINSSLYGKTVTCTGSTQTKTAVFDASGNAEIKGITDVGTITFTATDGSQTAETQISVPYFSNYPITMAFWAATVNLSTTSEDLKGKTITIRKGGAIVASTSFNAAGTATYIATSAGTYTFTCQGYSVEQAITEETTYNVSINSGLELSAWITAGSTTDYPLNPSSYANFAALEADEEAIRQLMLVHNAVDYLATAGADDALIEDVINSDICAKWINLSDYALDTLSANANVKSVMDTADKYGYGEWGLVNIATDTTKVSASSQYSSDYTASKAINTAPASGNKGWISQSGSSNSYLDYDCGEDVSIAYIYIGYCATSGASTTARYKIQGKKNGSSEWVDLTNEYTSILLNQWIKLTLIVSDTFRYYRLLEIERAAGGSGWVIQYCKYQPLGNVPIMTANNAPYGEAFGSNSSGQWLPWKAFDGDDTTTFWCTTKQSGSSAVGEYVGYTSVNPICVKKFRLKLTETLEYKLQGSNDNFASDIHDLGTYTIPASDRAGVLHEEIVENNDNYYTSHRIIIVSSGAYGSNTPACFTLQFYGRELKPLVPAMTSNTTPKGRVFAKDDSNPSSSPSWHAFSGINSYNGGEWGAENDRTYPSYIGYKSQTKIKVSMFRFWTSQHSSSTPGAAIKDFILQGSNDGSTWTDIYSGTFPNNVYRTPLYFISENPDFYKYHRIYILNTYGTPGVTYPSCGYIQFFGMDYSEKEFATGSTRKTIYDHGVELVELTAVAGTGIAEKQSNQIYIKGTAANARVYVHTTNVIDLSDYDYLRGVVGNRIQRTNGTDLPKLSVLSTPTDFTGEAAIIPTISDVASDPYNAYTLPISSIMESRYIEYLIYISSSALTLEGTLTEIWLE